MSFDFPAFYDETCNCTYTWNHSTRPTVRTLLQEWHQLHCERPDSCWKQRESVWTSWLLPGKSCLILWTSVSSVRIQYHSRQRFELWRQQNGTHDTVIQVMQCISKGLSKMWVQLRRRIPSCTGLNLNPRTMDHPCFCGFQLIER